tara:strand:+ start:7957 stop:8112 length:156 start_codon:yes stop_codon:yes gene_type:complete
MIFGVCAGISDFLGIDVRLIRILFIVAAITTASAMFWVYLLLGVFLPNKDD